MRVVTVSHHRPQFPLLETSAAAYRNRLYARELSIGFIVIPCVGFFLPLIRGVSAGLPRISQCYCAVAGFFAGVFSEAG